MNSINRAESLELPQGSARRPLLVLGTDGTRWDIVAEPGVGTTLQQLAAEGSWHFMEMEVPTMSGPGWASILTGSTHAEHGCTDNSMVGSLLWHYPDLLSKAFYQDQSTRTFAAAGWPVLVDPAGLGPVIHPRMEQQYSGLHNVIVRDGETYGYERADREVVDATLAKLRSDSAFDVGFAYQCEIDEAGHVWGLGGEEYRRAIRHVDERTAKILDVVRERYEKEGEDWLIVLVTDHGQRDEGGHGGATEREREAWVIAWSPSGNIPTWPDEIAPNELCQLMLDAR